MNWFIIIPVGIFVIALIAFLIKRNMKDEKDFESQINNDFHKTKNEEGDIKTEEETK